MSASNTAATTPRATLLRAAAGTGKTFALTQRYLSLLLPDTETGREGLEVERIVAITFTRKAAAELIERIRDVLVLTVRPESPQSVAASARVDDVAAYWKGVTADPDDHTDKLEAALARLGAAPVGTIDQFVSRLLAEFSLDARLPLGGPAAGDGDSAPIDLLDDGAADPERIIERCARALVNPADGPVRPDVATLLKEMSLGALIEAAKAPPTAAPVAATEDVLAALSFQCVQELRSELGDRDLAAALREFFVLPPLDAGTEIDDDAERVAIGKKLTDRAKLNDALLRPFQKWLAAGAKEPPPRSVFVVLASVHGRNDERWERTFGDKPLRLAFEVHGSKVLATPKQLLDKVGTGALAQDTVTRADKMRVALESIRRAVHHRARKRMAELGVLDYDARLAAATALCQDAVRGTGADGLLGRYDALLVDEVQDSSPAQIAFYQALAATHAAMHVFYVGDSRQSIYLFRGGEPGGMVALGENAEHGEPLLTNYRSTPALVAAQRELFDERLRQALAGEGLEPIESIVGLDAGREGPERGRPVTILAPGREDGGFDANKANRAALEAFAEHIRDELAREESTPGSDFAAVLSPSWKAAHSACRVLRTLLGPDPETGEPRVFVDGDKAWNKGRVVRDIAMWLHALSDPNNATAWLGVYKHPSVGLSDAALARICRSPEVEAGIEERAKADDADHQPEDEGQPSGAACVPAQGWKRRLGALHLADRLTGPHLPSDIVAFDRCRDVLREATGLVARSGAADALALVADRLGWRALLAVSPEDDALARFEVAMDWVRDLDASGLGAAAIADELVNASDPPRIELQRPAGSISCTTIFQAKGLKYDHVCVLSPGDGNRSGSDSSALVATLPGQDAPVALVSVKLDPTGALDPKPDLLSQLAKNVRGVRRRSELVRLLYVAVTRAVERVFLALPGKTSDSSIQAVLKAVWLPDDTEDDAAAEATADATARDASAAAFDHIDIRPLFEPRAPELPDGHTVKPTGTPRKRENTRTRWRPVAPSALHEHTASADRHALGMRAVEHAIAHGGYEKQRYDWQPVSAFEADAERRALLEAIEERRGSAESRLGTLVHAWLEAWGFDGAADRARVERWLRDHPGVPAEERDTLATWLTRLSELLATHPDHALWQLVTRDDVQKMPEHALLVPRGTAGVDGETQLLGGFADLLVRDPKAPPASRWTVIDFKAGKRFPECEPYQGKTTTDEAEKLMRGGHLDHHVPQLEGYAAAINRVLAGTEAYRDERVGQLALWYVRTGSAISWSPQQADEA